MSSAVRLPQELSSFLALDGPQTLLVRGPPGSGKTTLSLALLEAFRGDKFLVTSRVPNSELGREFPWLGNNGGRSIQIVDTSRMEDTVHHSGRLIRQSRQALLVPEVDPDRKFANFLWLPPPLQETWSRMDLTHQTLVVIDSWDALIEAYLAPGGDPEPGAPDRSQIERLLIRRMSDSPAHLVFILEREDQTALDYLVNGVVVTHREAINERLQRWLTILKMRGVRIDNAVYPYTLEDARFESILPLPPYSTLRAGRPDPEPDAMTGHLWPGSQGFASAFGRLPYGKSTLIELESSTPARVADLLVMPIAAQVIRAGGRVLIVPHPGQTPREVYRALGGAVTREKFVANTRCVVPPGPEPKEDQDLWKTVVTLTGPTPSPGGTDPTDHAALRFIREGASEKTPGLIAVSLQGLMSVAAAAGTPITASQAALLPQALQTAVRDAAIHTIIVAREESEIVQPLQVVSDIRLRGNIRMGRAFLYGIVPWTPSFLLVEGSETSPYELRRVV